VTTLDLAGVKVQDKVFEVGCGTGTLTLAAEKRVGPAGEVHGLEATPEMITVAQQKNGRARRASRYARGWPQLALRR
jgi:ubiquinone/menaquinone biosynthesis C-methylase UbiE